MDLPERQGQFERELQTRAERMAEVGYSEDTDQPPEEYRGGGMHGELESDITKVGNVYRALVTAHFPDGQSLDQVLQQIERLGLGSDSTIQVFGKEPPDAPGDHNDPGLEPGETALIVQFGRDDEAHHETVLRLCEEAGAKHARFYPQQVLGNPEPNEV